MGKTGSILEARLTCPPREDWLLATVPSEATMEPITIPLEVLGEEERDEDTIMQEQEVVMRLELQLPFLCIREIRETAMKPMNYR